MKKNIFKIALLTSLTSTSMVYADNLQSSFQDIGVPELKPAVVTPVDETKDLSEQNFDEILAAKIKDHNVEISKLSKDIFESDTQNNLDRYNKIKSYLLEKQAITKVMEENQRQAEIIRKENAAILKELETVKGFEEKKEEEKRVEEEKVIEQQQAIAPVITDNVIVYSVYGSSLSLTANISINGTKYDVQKGHIIEDFKVEDINKNGVTLLKNGVKQNINVSPQPTTFSSQQQVPQEPERIPNVIKPYELR